jgi:hypothetical protein
MMKPSVLHATSLMVARLRDLLQQHKSAGAIKTKGAPLGVGTAGRVTIQPHQIRKIGSTVKEKAAGEPGGSVARARRQSCAVLASAARRRSTPR